MAQAGALELEHLALDPDRGKPSQIERDAAVEGGHGVSFRSPYSTGSIFTVPSVTAGVRVEATCLEEDLGCGGVVAAALHDLAGVVEIDLTYGETLGEVNRVTRLEEDVETPALHLSRLVLVPQGCLGRLGHARAFRCH